MLSILGPSPPRSTLFECFAPSTIHGYVWMSLRVRCISSVETTSTDIPNSDCVVQCLYTKIITKCVPLSRCMHLMFKVACLVKYLHAAGSRL